MAQKSKYSQGLCVNIEPIPGRHRQQDTQGLCCQKKATAMSIASAQGSSRATGTPRSQKALLQGKKQKQISLLFFLVKFSFSASVNV